MAVLVIAAGCGRDAGRAAADASPAKAESSADKTQKPPAATTSFDFIRAVSQCTFGQRGPLLDFGEDGIRVRGPVGEELSLERVEREGASFAKVRERSVSVPFFVTADEERLLSAAPTTVSVRLREGAARTAAVFVNDKPAGTVKIEKGEATVVTARASGPLLEPGLNEVMIRFQAPSRTERDVRALVDWVHVTSGEPEKNFAAPAVRDVVLDRPLAGALKKVFGLRAESYVRCVGFLPQAGVLELELGAEGSGDVEIEVRLVRDRVAPVSLGRLTASGAQTARGRYPLDPHLTAGAIGGIELVVVRAAKGARALIGEPRIVVPPPSPVSRPPPMRGVVLVVLGTVDPRSLVPYGGALGSQAIAPLAQAGTIFTRHRGSSTLPSAALAAMLTGRGPRMVRLEDEGARLPASVTTVADAVRQAGVVNAFFTANPMTTAPFGFDRAWSTHSVFLPEADPSGIKALEEATQWLRARKDERFLLVVHARGGHPPWFATPEQLKTMAPDAYTGGLDPKHAGELLSKARRTPPQLRFSDADRTRAFALHSAAVAEHDRALAAMLAELRSGDREDKTLVIVTGDVGVNTAQAVPFGDAEPPNEQLLATPLIVRGRGLFPAGASIASPTSDIDLAKTMLAALGLPPPAQFEGLDLVDVLASPEPALARPQFATVTGRHSLRWGSLVLDASERRESLCDVALEPLCTTDVRPTHPLAALVLGRKLAQLRTDPAATSVAREPASPDAHVSSALRAWGR